MGRFVTFLFLLSAFQLAEVISSSVEKSFKDHEIVPDIIPIAPTELLKINYPSGAEALEGNELTPTQVKDQPTVEWTAEPNAFYTLCLTDPDAPSRAKPIRREWHHWLVTNIAGGDLASGDVLSEYVGSGPPKDTGLHRYIFLLYKQPKKIDFSEPKLTNRSGEGRGKFSVAKFAEKYTLGTPIAGNFYQAAFDDYVPILHKKLGF